MDSVTLTTVDAGELTNHGAHRFAPSPSQRKTFIADTSQRYSTVSRCSKGLSEAVITEPKIV